MTSQQTQSTGRILAIVQLTEPAIGTFHAQALSIPDILRLRFTVSGGNLPQTLEKTVAANGDEVQQTFDLPVGEKYVIAAQGLDNNEAPIPGAQIYAWFNVTPGTQKIRISWQSTPLGKVLSHLYQTGQRGLIAKLDLPQLQEKLDLQLGNWVQQQGNLFMRPHHSYYDPELLEQKLVESNGTLDTIPAETLVGQMGQVLIEGGLPGDTVQLRIQDPASPPIVQITLPPDYFDKQPYYVSIPVTPTQIAANNRDWLIQVGRDGANQVAASSSTRLVPKSFQSVPNQSVTERFRTVSFLFGMGGGCRTEGSIYGLPLGGEEDLKVQIGTVAFDPNNTYLAEFNVLMNLRRQFSVQGFGGGGGGGTIGIGIDPPMPHFPRLCTTDVRPFNNGMIVKGSGFGNAFADQDGDYFDDSGQHYVLVNGRRAPVASWGSEQVAFWAPDLNPDTFYEAFMQDYSIPGTLTTRGIVTIVTPQASTTFPYVLDARIEFPQPYQEGLSLTVNQEFPLAYTVVQPVRNQVITDMPLSWYAYNLDPETGQETLVSQSGQAASPGAVVHVDPQGIVYALAPGHFKISATYLREDPKTFIIQGVVQP